MKHSTYWLPELDTGSGPRISTLTLSNGLAALVILTKGAITLCFGVFLREHDLHERTQLTLATGYTGVTVGRSDAGLPARWLTGARYDTECGGRSCTRARLFRC